VETISVPPLQKKKRKVGLIQQQRRYQYQYQYQYPFQINHFDFSFTEKGDEPILYLIIG